VLKLKKIVFPTPPMPTIGMTETLLLQFISACPALPLFPLDCLALDVDATQLPTAALFPLDPANAFGMLQSLV